jgi:putative transposase
MAAAEGLYPSYRSRSAICYSRLSKQGFKVSMSGKGNYYDNFMVETFFKSIKVEQIWCNRWETRRQAEEPIFQ